MDKNIFKFEGLIINRIIVHRINIKDDNKQRVSPRLSSKLINIEGEGLDAIQSRITEALGSKSHGLEVSIEDVSEDSFFKIAAASMHINDEGFIENTKKLANKLTDAQLQTTSPGGLLAIVQGRITDNALPFLAVIKAETQSGFNTKEDIEHVFMEYIAELALTPHQKFYKLGFLAEIISEKEPTIHNYRAFLFDHLLTKTDTAKAATYFYNHFLGMSLHKSSKKLTEDFYTQTKNFINTAPVDKETKIDMHNALRVELLSNNTTLNVSDFANSHIPPEIKDEYVQFMRQNNFPEQSISKDIDYIKSKLKSRQKLVFSNDIWISIPPGDTAKELIKFDKSTGNIEYTTIQIKGKFVKQE